VQSGLVLIQGWIVKEPTGMEKDCILWRVRPQSITPSGCPPQRCVAQQRCQENASPGRFPFLYPPTSLSQQRSDSPDARGVCAFVRNVAIEPPRCSCCLRSKPLNDMHRFPVYFGHVHVSTLHHSTTRRMSMQSYTSKIYPRRTRVVPLVRASSRR